MAEEITLGLTIVEDSNIEVKLLDKTLNISLTSDVDFTEFVRELAKHIPSKSEIVSEMPISENPKTILVLNTISSIIDAFNNAISNGDEAVREITE